MDPLKYHAVFHKATACLFSLSSTLPPQIVASSLSVAVFSSSDISARSTSRTGTATPSGHWFPQAWPKQQALGKQPLVSPLSFSLFQQQPSSRQTTTRISLAFTLLIPSNNLSANTHTRQPRFHSPCPEQQPLGKYPHVSASLSLSLPPTSELRWRLHIKSASSLPAQEGRPGRDVRNKINPLPNHRLFHITHMTQTCNLQQTVILSICKFSVHG